MTMPHLHNCPHHEDGWCLSCVKQLHDERRCDIRPCVERFARTMEKVLCENSAKVDLPRPSYSELSLSLARHVRAFLGWVETSSQLRTFNNRTLEDASESAEKQAADIANWLMLGMGWDINEE